MQSEIETPGFTGFMWLVDARYARPGEFSQGHECSVGNLWIAACRRKSVATHPRVHVGDHGAPEILDGQRRLQLLSEQIAFSFFWRERAGKMLQPGEMIDAYVG